MATVSQPFNGSRCKATNRRGEPCGRRASDHGYCVAHSGRLDMRELGKLGGKVRPSTKLRQSVDDELREQAREVLAKALRGEEVPKAALDSARSLFAYRPSVPPAGEQHPAQEGQGGKPVGLADLVRLAFQHGLAVVAGGEVLVDGQRVERVDTPPAAKENRPGPPSIRGAASATKESSEALPLSDLGPPADAPEPIDTDPPAAFEESQAAKLVRRYGTGTEQGHDWWHA